jgi:phosphomannomutase
MDDSIFKAYDIRGIYPESINENIVSKIGYFYVKLFDLKNICVGKDIRSSSPSLFNTFVKGAILAGAKITDIGVISTDMMYFASGFYDFDGGAQITASHNPKEYNGIKLVRHGEPISSDDGIFDIRDIVKKNIDINLDLPESFNMESKNILNDYIKHVLSFVDCDEIKDLKVAVDVGNGVAGYIVEEIFKYLKCTLVPLYFDPDENFPNHPANPMDENNVKDLERKIIESGADLGIAFDGDADRCAFVDEKGGYTSGYFMTAILAKNILANNKGGKIVHSPQLIWAVDDTVKDMGGISIISKTGHSFIAKKMKEEDAIFGGEISSHFYFKKNYYSDNGMVPMLMVLELLSREKVKLSSLLDFYRNKYFTTPEINYTVSDTNAKIKQIEEYFKDKNGKISYLDGISVEFEDWRFNVRASNTEPLLRLNAEAKSQEILDKNVKIVESIINS